MGITRSGIGMTNELLVLVLYSNKVNVWLSIFISSHLAENSSIFRFPKINKRMNPIFVLNGTFVGCWSKTQNAFLMSPLLSIVSRENSGPPASSVAEKVATAGFLSINPSFSADLKIFLQRKRTLLATVG